MGLVAAAVVAAPPRSPLSALGLEAAGDFVAIDRAGINHRKVAASLGLGAERNVFAIDGTGDGRGPALSVQRASKFGAVLLEFERGLASAVTALPGHLPIAGDIGRLAITLSGVLGQKTGC